MLARAEKIEYIGLLEEQARRRLDKIIQINFDMMYEWQREFVAKTGQYYEGCLCAANQIGKTFTGATIDAAHATGDYPEGWEGFKFSFAPLIWCLGYSMEKCRDLLQNALFGKYDSNSGFSGGIVPKSRIIKWESATGTPNAMRSVWVKHSSSTAKNIVLSCVQFWSYTQGQHAIMGDVVDWFHVDEEPRDQNIRPQLLTRTINGDNGRGGRGIYTFTPENGRTQLVIKFKDDPSSSQFYMQKGWDEAPHITPEKGKRLMDAYPEHQRAMRTKGDPILGEGRIYEVSDEFVQCEMPDVQPEWFVINGMDFGWDHPQAHIKLLEDRENGIFYVVNAYKARKTSANDAWGAVQPWSKGIPTAWPHDGLQNEKGRGDDNIQLKTHYANAGFNMLAKHATWTQGGMSVETGLFEMNNLMTKGLFKFVKGLPDIMDEYRQYHRASSRDNHQLKIVKTFDDLLDAVRYAYMMRRFAVRVGDVGVTAKPIDFAGWGRK